MGMFDCVKYEMLCPFCGTKLDDFQTKSAGKSMATLEVKNIPYGGDFYDYCDGCGAHILFTKGSFEDHLEKIIEQKDDLSKEEILEKIKRLSWE